MPCMTSFGRFMSGIKFKAATLPQGDNNNNNKKKKRQDQKNLKK